MSAAGRLEVEGTRQRVTLAVFDSEPTSWPILTSAGPSASAGRGLNIVAAISSAWGITAGPAETCVWCELR
jgi:hypothetical protein